MGKNYQSIQGILNSTDRRPWELPASDTPQACPAMDTTWAYSLDDLADEPFNNPALINLRWCYTAGRTKFRLQDSKESYNTLEDAIKLESYLLDGYYVDERGQLVLEFLPKNSASMREQAQKAVESLNRLKRQGFSQETCSQEENVRMQQLRDKFSKRLYVSGVFEAWDDMGEAEAVVMASTGKKMIVIEVEDGVKVRRAVYDLTGKKHRVRHYVYE